jgi:hypothetical protein
MIWWMDDREKFNGSHAEFTQIEDLLQNPRYWLG